VPVLERFPDARNAKGRTIVFAPMLRQAYPGRVAKSKYTDPERERTRDYRDSAKKYRASATKTKKLTDRPALIQLAQLYDILADSIEANFRIDRRPD
jgi:hypothetical protein